MREPKTVVIRLTPKIRLAIFAMVSGCLALLLLSFFWGALWTVDREANLREKTSSLTTAINRQLVERKSLEQQLAIALKSAEIDRLASKELESALAEHYRTEAQLQRDLAFYKKLMAPDELDKGFTVHSVELFHEEISGRYSYKVVVTNAGGGNSVIKGSLTLLLLTANGNEEQEVPLTQLPEFEGKNPQKLRFRFFQNVVGGFKLPADYQPVSMVVNAQIGSQSAPYHASYRWQDIITETQNVRNE